MLYYILDWLPSVPLSLRSRLGRGSSSNSLGSSEVPSEVRAGRALPTARNEPILVEESQAMSPPAQQLRALNIYEKKFLEKADAYVPDSPMPTIPAIASVDNPFQCEDLEQLRLLC